MNESSQAPARRSIWPALLLWLSPWALYLGCVLVTLVGANGSRRWFGWLHPVTKNDVLLSLALIVVLWWAVARLLIGLRLKQVWFACVAGVLELPVALLVYVFWAVGMIGGPINPG